ncbi:hypothetical protein V1511DRAFT_502047 [Dipodascopsis uninucleata]
MDFTALLSKEIAKKKRQVNEVTGGDGSESSQSAKYIRRADIEKERQKKYLEDKARREEEHRKAQEKKRKEREEEEKEREEKRREIERKRQLQREKSEQGDANPQSLISSRSLSRSRTASLSPSPSKGSTKDNTPDIKQWTLYESLSEEDIVKRFRRYGVPIQYFDESQKARLRRLRKLDLKNAATNDNSLEKQIEEIDFNIDSNEIGSNQPKIYMQLEKYIRFLIKEWQSVLVSRGDTPERAFAILEESKAYLQPLLVQLRKQNLHDQIYPSLSTMMMYLQQRKYRDANDTYLKLSIGNAAWPIGVTAVGIHERSARERITGHDKDSKVGTLGKSNHQIAHVMSDERTRKWLTALKRLITFCEGQWP